jgi:hypothetical protein
MIERIDTYSLLGESDDLTQVSFARTIFVPAVKVTATISLSAMTIGFKLVRDAYQMGFIGTVIRKAGFSPSPGRSDDIPVATDWSRNGLTLDKCTYVTFQLTVVMAEAMALCTLAFYEPGGDREAVKPTKAKLQTEVRPQALVVDKKSGLVRTVHYLNAAEGARVPSERFLTQAIRKCASDELKVEPRTLEIVYHDDPAFRFKPGVRWDRKAKKLRS